MSESTEKKPQPKVLSVPARGWEQLRAFVSLTAEQLQSLESELGNLNSLNSNIPQTDRLAQVLGVTRRTAANIETALANLRLQKARLGLTDDEIIEDIRSGLDTDISPPTPEHWALIARLLTETKQERLRDKAESLATSLVPHFVKAKTICDIRPVFDEDRTKVEGVFLVTLLGITSHMVGGEETTTTVQLGRRDLAELRDTLADADKKLAALEGELGKTLKVL